MLLCNYTILNMLDFKGFWAFFALILLKKAHFLAENTYYLENIAMPENQESQNLII